MAGIVYGERRHLPLGKGSLRMSDPYPGPRPPIVPRTEIRPFPLWTWLAIAGIVVALVVLGVVFVQIDRQTTVPNLVGKNQQEIAAILTSSGLKLGAVRQVETTTAPVGQVLAQNPPAGKSVPKGTSVTVTVAIEPIAATVPDVRGLDATAAVTAIQQSGLTAAQSSVYSTATPGTVVGQIPAPGVTLPIGEVVTVVVSGGTTAKTVAVPALVGVSSDAATESARAAGLSVKAIQAYSDTAATGTVIAQSPKAGESARVGSTVAVLISRGKGSGSSETIPGVTGSTQASAEDAVRAHGLTPVVTFRFGSQTVGTVVEQFPSANTTQAAGGEVLLVVAKSGTDLVTVPSLTGLSQAQAETQLTTLGLTARLVSSPTSAYPVGSVSDQIPASGAKMPAGSDVVIGIARAPSQ
jgi:beta-lactam-binding protein with PASTA domain